MGSQAREAPVPQLVECRPNVERANVAVPGAMAHRQPRCMKAGVHVYIKPNLTCNRTNSLLQNNKKYSKTSLSLGFRHAAKQKCCLMFVEMPRWLYSWTLTLTHGLWPRLRLQGGISPVEDSWAMGCLTGNSCSTHGPGNRSPAGP